MIANRLKHFLVQCDGATAIEYAVMASGIGILLVSAVDSIGSSLVSIFSSISTGF